MFRATIDPRSRLHFFSASMASLKTIERVALRDPHSFVYLDLCLMLAKFDADNEYGMIDSTIVQAHQHSAGAIKKERKPSTWAQQRVSEYEDSRDCGCLGEPYELYTNSRPGA
ncbi:MAG: hypothetical protein JJU12_00590 [Chlamydiales bacterium]|nr:hypothetical protein [Chlamydiales bacterium]